MCYAGDELSEAPEDDEHGNSERLGAECNACRTAGPLQGKVADHFCGHARAGAFFEWGAIVQSTNLGSWCEPDDDQHGNSERLGAEFNTSRTKRPMLVQGRFSSGVQSSRAPTWAAGTAGGKLSEEPEDDENGNSERLGAEFSTSRTKRPLAGRS